MRWAPDVMMETKRESNSAATVLYFLSQEQSLRNSMVTQRDLRLTSMTDVQHLPPSPSFRVALGGLYS